MKKFSTGCIYYFLMLLAVSSSGCATYNLWHYDGKYSTIQAPERAIILRDGRVVIDFSENKDVDYYYKRVYFRPEDFGPVKERASDMINKLGGSLESRIVQYVETAKGDNEKGNWELLDWRHRRELPVFPEQDSNIRACMNFHKEIIRSSGTQIFEICNENKERVSIWTVPYEYEKKRLWLYYPAQLLYIPALAFDIVTFPVQLVAFIYTINSLKKLSIGR